MMRFDQFTADAQDAAARAYEIVQRYTHTQVDTEHIFLSLLEQPEGPVSQILNVLTVDVAALKDRLDQVLGAQPKVVVYGGSKGFGQLFYTPRTRTILEFSSREAKGLKDKFISTEHIFLAILSESNTPSARILQEFGVERERVLEVIGRSRAAGKQRASDGQPGAEAGEVNAARLEAFLGEYFTLEELRILCKRLDVDDEAVSNAIKGAFAHELVNQMKRDGRLWELVRAAFIMD